MNVIETERLYLSRLSTDDASFILRLLNDPAWLQFIGDRGVKNLDDARKYILNGPMKSYDQFGFGLYLTKLKDGKVPIGICGLLKREYLKDVDVGFALLPEFRRKGYAVESAAAVLGLKRVAAITQSDNLKSINVLKKIGLEFKKVIVLPEDRQEIELYGKEL
jgi:RimJ/RimL family protein N-acetyltransferase